MDMDEVTIHREQTPIGRLRTCVSEQIEANSVETERIVEPGPKGMSSSDRVAKLGDFGRKKPSVSKGICDARSRKPPCKWRPSKAKSPHDSTPSVQPIQLNFHLEMAFQNDVRDFINLS